MDNPLAIIAYLLARMIAQNENTDITKVLEEACAATMTVKRERKPSPEVDKEAVERIYKLYPTKCPIQGRSLGKCAKNKDKIAILLRSMPEDKLAATIKRYIEESTASKSYFKDFSTLLNNLPDYDEQQSAPIAEEERGANLFDDPEVSAWLRARKRNNINR